MVVLLVVLATLSVMALGVAMFYATRQAKAATRDRLGLANSITSTLLAAVALVVTALGLTQDSGTETTQQSTKNTGSITIHGNTGGGICAYVQGDCPSTLPDPKDLATMPIEKAADELSAIPGADKDPTGNPPWTFMILGTGNQGVYYRDGYTVKDHRLAGEPVVRDSRPVYVDCKVEDGWIADSTAPNKSALKTWLKVRYPEPADEGDYWVYGGYAYPLGNNGEVPDC